MSDWKEVKAAVNAQAERFCREFLDQGHLAAGGKEWRLGSIDNERSRKGKAGSFSVCLEGPKQGLVVEGNSAADTGAKSLVDVYMHLKGVDFVGAMRGLEQWVGKARVSSSGVTRTGGVSGPYRAAVPHRDAPPPVRLEGEPVREGSAAWLYLTEERWIDPEVIRRARVHEGSYWFGQLDARVPGLAFPSYSADGKTLLMVKMLTVGRWFCDGPLKGKPESARNEADAGGIEPEKLVRANKGARYHLIGMDTVTDPSKPVVIAEGEVDWLSWLSAGVQAVTVPFGAKADSYDERTGQWQVNAGNRWIDEDWEWLETLQDPVVAMDADEAGRAANETLYRRLGGERTRLLTWPREGDDANEVFTRDPEELHRCLNAAAGRDPEELRGVRSYELDIWRAFFPENGEEEGWPTPFKMDFRFRPGETTVWTGYNKHGKTICQTFTMVHLAKLGQPVCIASLEISAAKTLQNVMRMAIGRSKPVKVEMGVELPDEALFAKALTWMENRFFIYDKVGSVEIDDVLKCFRYAARRYGVTQFVLDSLMKLSVNEEDAEQIKELMNKVTAFAREYGVHVHFVAHSKKSSEKRPEERFPPRKHDVKGSVAITNIPDNVIVIWRNKGKERGIEEQKVLWERFDKAGEMEKRDAVMKKIDEMEKQGDAMWLVEGQRYGTGAEPMKYLWFDVHGSWQYFENAEGMEKGARVYV